MKLEKDKALEINSIDLINRSSIADHDNRKWNLQDTYQVCQIT